MSQERLGHYRILEQIATGAQGSVYRAFDPEAGLLVALKVLHDTVVGDPSYLERFHREASLASSMDHPNVARIFDVGEDNGRHYIALEYLPENLASLIAGGALPVDRVAKLAVGIADGLAEIHALGIVHRDLKPQNVLITQEGTPKVTDFGIARTEAASSMTATGAVMGTPYYMAPEQARGDLADARSDVYALGCVIYQMLTGELPFEAPTPLAVIRQHIEQEPRPVGHVQKGIPREVAEIVEKAMNKDPDQRYANGAEIALALRQAVPGLRAEPGATSRSGSIPAYEPRIAADTLRLSRPGTFGRLARRFAIAGAAVVGIAVVAAIAINVLQNRTPAGPDQPGGIVEKAAPDNVANPELARGEIVVETARPDTITRSLQTPGTLPVSDAISNETPDGEVSLISAGATAIANAAATATATAPLNARTGPVLVGTPISGALAGEPDDSASATPSAATPQFEPIAPPVLITEPAPAPDRVISEATESHRWVTLDSFTFDSLGAVAIDPANQIHVAGNQGSVFRSGDDGATWHRQRLDEACSFRELEFVSVTHAFALDECGGSLFSSNDGGLTWSRNSEINPSFGGINDIDFINLDTGWASGPSGFLAVTKNGGESWDQLSVPTRSSLNAVYFADENRGWLGGLNGGLLQTDDGGVSWQLVRTPTDCQINHIAARGSLVWAAGDCDQVIFSADGGATWEDRSFQSGSGTNFTDIEFLDDQTAWISGMQYEPERPVIMKTHDGGKSWKVSSSVEALGFGYIRDMAVRVTPGGVSGWAVGASGLLLKLVTAEEYSAIVSAGAGEVELSGAPDGAPRSELPLTFTWQRLGEFTFDALHSVAVVDSDRAHIAGEGSAIYRTLDGGASFDVSDVPSGCSTLDLQFVSSEVGITADECSGNLIRSNDAGESWTRHDNSALQDSGGSASFFLNAEQGWVAGWNGVMARTSNGGSTWEKIDLPTSDAIETIYFVNENHGWISGPHSIILRTRDGGDSWERARTPNIRCRISDIDAHLPYVWAVDDCGGVFTSSDGGETWDDRSLDDRGKDLTAVAVWDADTAWVAGRSSNGNWPVIMETRNGGATWTEVFSAPDIGGSMEDISVADGPDGIAGWAVGQSGLIVKLTRTGI